jgi:hypothetical protein
MPIARWRAPDPRSRRSRECLTRGQVVALGKGRAPAGPAGVPLEEVLAITSRVATRTDGRAVTASDSGRKKSNQAPITIASTTATTAGSSTSKATERLRGNT